MYLVIISRLLLNKHTHTYTPFWVFSSYKESRNNMPIYGYMLSNLSPSPNLYKVQSVYNNNVASWSLHRELRPFASSKFPQRVLVFLLP